MIVGRSVWFMLENVFIKNMWGIEYVWGFDKCGIMEVDREGLSIELEINVLKGSCIYWLVWDVLKGIVLKVIWKFYVYFFCFEIFIYIYI